MPFGADLIQTITKRLAANATFALLLSLSFAGITGGDTSERASASNPPACPTYGDVVFTLQTVTFLGQTKTMCATTITDTAGKVITLPGAMIFGVDIAGGAGGRGGSDNGAGSDGNPNVEGSRGSILTGEVELSGQIGLYPGGKGGDGKKVGFQGPAGVSAIGLSGGLGGPDGSFNFSGGGGGGGAGSAITVAGQIALIAGGGGGSGGVGYCYNGDSNGPGAQLAPPYTHVPRNSGESEGATPVTAASDGGGGGGGGGGFVGGAAGAVRNVLCGQQYDAPGSGGHFGSSKSSFGGKTLSVTTPTSSTVGNAGAGYIKLYLPAPGVPDLQAASDLGSLPTDNLTSITTPVLDLTGLIGGQEASITFTKGSTVLTHAFTPVGTTHQFTVPEALSDGQWSVVTTTSIGTSDPLLLTIDTVAPTASSVSIVPDLVNPKRVRVTINFSEALASVDASKVLLGFQPADWTKSGASISGSAYSFDVTYLELVEEDILISVAEDAVTDLAGNLLVDPRSFLREVDLATLSASFEPGPVRIANTPNTKTLTLTFSRDVWGLTTSDLTWPATNGGTCSTVSISPSVGPASVYTIEVRCTATGAAQTSTLRLAANAVKDFASISGPSASIDLTVIKDTTAPTVTSVTGNYIGNQLEYSVTFSEELSIFPVSAITTTGSPATGTWVYSTPVRVGSTNTWTFTGTNATPTNGNHAPVFNTTTGIRDLAGNPLSAGFSANAVKVEVLPTFTIGTLASPTATAIALAPNFNLTLSGGTMHGIRLTNLSWAGSGSTKDAFSVTLGPMGSSASTSTGNDWIQIVAPNATEAQWEAAVRSIRFDAGSNSGSRTFDFHLIPVSGYDIESGVFFDAFRSATSVTQAQAKTLAPNHYRFGYRGYLATPDSTSQAAASKNFTTALTDTYFWVDLLRSASSVTNESGLSPDVAASQENFTYWDTTHPTATQPEARADEIYVFADRARERKWHDAYLINTTNAYMVEFGLRPGDSLQTRLKASASTVVDSSEPTVESVTAITANGTYVVGEKIRIEVDMSENTIVTGTPRLKLNVAPTLRYANYVSGSGSDKLVFEYTVVAGDLAADLNYADTASLELNSGTLKDAAGNNADRALPAINSADSLGGGAAVAVDADRFIAPTFALGSMPSIGYNVVHVVPNFDVQVRGNNKPFGIRITNKTYDPNASTLDSFILNPVPTGVTVVTNSAGVIELFSETLTEAQWEAAIRAIQFDAGSSQTAPEFDFHVRPLKAYDYSTGHAYKFFSPSGTYAQHKALAEASVLAGVVGYLANPTSAQESSIIATYAGVSGYAIIGLQKQTATTGSATTVKVVAPAEQAGNIEYRNWSGGEPSVGIDLCTMVYQNGLWNDQHCNDIYTGYLVEYGGLTPETNFLGLMVQSHTFEFDLTPPAVTSVTALSPAGDYVAGDQISIRVRFSEPITVTGSPQLKLDMGPNVRPVNCAAAAINTDLVCTYTVQQGDVSPDLNYLDINSLILNGGSIVDAAANPAVLTLPALNSLQSLAGSSALEIDGNKNELTLSAANPTSTSRSLVFTVTSTLPIDCSSLSTQDGVDFRFNGISSIDGITASQDNKTCTINATSAVLPGQYGVSALQRAATFSVNDLQNPPVATTSVAIQNASVDVEVAAPAGQGYVVVNPVAGQRRTIFEKELPAIVSAPNMQAGRAALERNNVLASPAGNPGAMVEGDFSQASSRIDAKTREQITAGDKVTVTLSVDPSMAATHEVIVYFRSTLDPESMGWAYLGKRDFDVSGLAVSEPMVFTKRGTYYLKLIVILKGTQFRMAAEGPRGFRAAAYLMPPLNFGTLPQDLGYLSNPTPILDADLPTGVQILEVAVEVVGTEPTVNLPPSANNNLTSPTSPAPTQNANPTPTATPTAPTPTSSPTPSPPIAATEEPAAPEEPMSESAQETKDTASAPGSEEGSSSTVGEESGAEAVQPTVEATEPTPEPSLANELEAYDPFGSAEATRETVGLLAALGALGALAGAAGAAAAAAATGRSAGASGSSSSSAGMASAEMNEDSLDAMAGAEFELDVFRDEKERWGDKLAIWALPILSFLDRPTHRATRSAARYSPLVSKLINDGSYLRAMLGSVSILPTIAAIILAILGLQENESLLLHPPVAIFIVMMVIGLLDAFAGALGVLVFVLGSLPMVNASEITDWRMLAGIAVAGFGPIILARSIRNFRREAPRDTQGWLDRVGDIGFASLLGGWVAGLVLRALPALTGLAVPAAENVSTIQVIATIVIALRIGLEDLAARFYPSRMDELTPDGLPEPFKGQQTLVLGIRYLFYVFVASAFMGLGLIVWIAAALFLIPSLWGLVVDKLPRVPFLAKWLPSGLPALAMMLGLEIFLEGALSANFGDHPDFSIIFVFSLLGLIILLSVLAVLARPFEGDEHWLRKPSNRWVNRLGGVVTFLLLVQFTSML